MTTENSACAFWKGGNTFPYCWPHYRLDCTMSSFLEIWFKFRVFFLWFLRKQFLMRILENEYSSLKKSGLLYPIQKLQKLCDFVFFSISDTFTSFGCPLQLAKSIHQRAINHIYFDSLQLKFAFIFPSKLLKIMRFFTNLSKSSCYDLILSAYAHVRYSQLLRIDFD